MLSIITEPNAPYAATLVSDLRQVSMPHVVCVVKSRFVFCVVDRRWVGDTTPPDFQDIDCWETIPTRCVTDLVPEKQQSELLLWGKVNALASIFIRESNGLRTLVKTGTFMPEPPLYWQSEWKTRPVGDWAKMHFMTAPSYARVSQLWNTIDGLGFKGIFSHSSVATESFFQTNRIAMSGTLVSAGVQSNTLFGCDSICVNTEAGYIDMLWRARFPWDLMSGDEGVLWLKIG